jgi:ribosomal-protein-alanine N-acetyltransferase
MRIDIGPITLLPFGQQHLTHSRYIKWLRDYEVVRYLGRDEYLTEISIAEIEEYVRRIWENKFVHFFAIELQKEKEFIGTCKISQNSERERNSNFADIGIMLGEKAHWGQGIATMVIKAISVYAFESLNFRKLSAGAISANTGVIRAFEKSGFIHEARLRQTIKLENSYYDHILMGCFPHELRT